MARVRTLAARNVQGETLGGDEGEMIPVWGGQD